MRAHLDLPADEFERRGLAPVDARAAASRAFGGLEQAKDRHRDARSFVWVDDAVRDPRHSTRLLRRNPLFALTAVLSLAIGIYGVSAYMVTSRTREFGIRIALGARPATVLAMVLRQGLSLAVVGSALGLALSAVAGRLMRAFLFGAAPVDLVTFVAVAGTFLPVGLAASYWPARRATRIDPIEALRYE